MRRVGDAVVLAGGFGTRLAHVVPGVCKPMAPVADRPFLRYVLDQLAAAGVGRVVVADGYRRGQIEGFFGDAYRGMRICYSPEDEPLGTGGAVKRALGKLESERAFVLNGDTFCDVDFAEMEGAALRAPEAAAVLAVKRLRDFDRYGTVDVGGDGIIRSFSEKAPCAEGLVNTGIYLLRADALDDMPERFSLESDYFERVVGHRCLRAVECGGDFIDIGIPEDYERAQSLLAPRARGRAIAFFDRDGTINVDTGHLFEPEKIELIPSTVELLRRYAAEPDCAVVVVTNQAGIAKGLYSEGQMRSLHAALSARLEGFGCRVDAWYFCPHHPDFTGPCDCRKPAPGMLLAAMRDFDARPEECVMYGDSDSDRLAAEAAGVAFHFAGAALEEEDIWL